MPIITIPRNKQFDVETHHALLEVSFDPKHAPQVAKSPPLPSFLLSFPPKRILGSCMALAKSLKPDLSYQIYRMRYPIVIVAKIILSKCYSLSTFLMPHSVKFSCIIFVTCSVNFQAPFRQ